MSKRPAYQHLPMIIVMLWLVFAIGLAGGLWAVGYRFSWW